MKRLTCEMCGGTDLIKQDGVFVCQSCGCKYSVEEARKMMVEVSGTVEVKNAAQLENVLKLANSSFESKNYAQAEEFCNQVIAMDDKNYEAWKLKGEAINYQINAKNQRILEVYNCIMTAYRVLPDEEKESKKNEIIALLKTTCFEGEIRFWLKQFEANRPTNEALTRVKDAYTDASEKMAAAFDELGFEDIKKEYLANLSNFFIELSSATCNSTWQSTVGYNYYRDYLGKGKDPFSRIDTGWVIGDTDLYRPTERIWRTFLEEADNLIELLQFAEKQFNDDTSLKVKEAIYSNIIYFEECIIPSKCWEITQGYTSNWDQYKTLGWHEKKGLTGAAQAIRRSTKSKYKEKKHINQKKAEKQYWAAHAEEKAALMQEKKALEDKVAATGVDSAAKQIKQINARIDSLTAEYIKLGTFQIKRSSELNKQIAAAKAELKAAEKAYNEEFDHNEIESLKARIAKINAELTKDRL